MSTAAKERPLSKKTHPDPTTAMSSPAAAGPIVRATLNEVALSATAFCRSASPTSAEATVWRAADEEGYVRSYILYPPCVWGVRRGALIDAGVSKVLSPALDGMAQLSIALGKSALIGRGLNKWAHVEVHERTYLSRTTPGSEH